MWIEGSDSDEEVCDRIPHLWTALQMRGSALRFPQERTSLFSVLTTSTGLSLSSFMKCHNWFTNHSSVAILWTKWTGHLRHVFYTIKFCLLNHFFSSCTCGILNGNCRGNMTAKPIRLDVTFNYFLIPESTKRTFYVKIWKLKLIFCCQPAEPMLSEYPPILLPYFAGLDLSPIPLWTQFH